MTKVAFAPYWEDDDLWSPPELAADLVVSLLDGDLDSYSGRFIHAVNDDWRSWPAK